jgi:hypothetical protein
LHSRSEFATIPAPRNRFAAPRIDPRQTMDEIDEQEQAARLRTERFGLIVALMEIAGTLIGATIIAARFEWPNPLVPIGIVALAIGWSAFRFLRHVRRKY